MTVVQVGGHVVEVGFAHGFVKLSGPFVQLAEDGTMLIPREAARKLARALSLNADAASPDASASAERPAPVVPRGGRIDRASPLSETVRERVT